MAARRASEYYSTLLPTCQEKKSIFFIKNFFHKKVDSFKNVWYNGFGARTPFVKNFTKFQLGTTNQVKSSHFIIACFYKIVNTLFLKKYFKIIKKKCLTRVKPYDIIIV